MTCHIWRRQMVSLLCGSLHVSSNCFFLKMTCHIRSRQMVYGHMSAPNMKRHLTKKINLKTHEMTHAGKKPFTDLLAPNVTQHLTIHTKVWFEQPWRFGKIIKCPFTLRTGKCLLQKWIISCAIKTLIKCLVTSRAGKLLLSCVAHFLCLQSITSFKSLVR